MGKINMGAAQCRFRTKPAGGRFSGERKVVEGMPMDSTDRKADRAFLRRLLGDSLRFAVAIVERDHACIHVSERFPWQSSSPGGEALRRRFRQGRARDYFERLIECSLPGHLEKVVHELTEIDETRPRSRLAIGGSEEIVEELLGMLPEVLSRKVTGVFPVDFTPIRSSF